MNTAYPLQPTPIHRQIRPQPLKQRYPWGKPKEKRMTIAAGFVGRDGILLCADTMHTDGYTKFYDDKLFTWTGHGAAVCFAVAGNATIAKMAVHSCKAALDSIEEADLSSGRILSEIQTIFKSVQEQYIDTRPAHELNNAQIYCLFGIQMRSETGVIAPVAKFDCIGVGRQLGFYIIEPSYRQDMSVSELAILAIHALAAAKERTDGVGGRSQFLVIRDGTVSPVIPYDYDVAEKQVLEYRQKATNLLLDIGDKGIDDKEFNDRLQWFAEEALALRATWKGGAAPWEYLTQRIARYLAETEGPPGTKDDSSLQQPLPEFTRRVW
jgi:hypothetical protein